MVTPPAYAVPWLLEQDYSNGMRRHPEHEPVLWDATLASVPSFEHDDVVGTTEGQIAYLDAVRDYGVAVVRNTPAVEGEVERFAEKIGHVRETAFERVHNVRHDPAGYNVAHTARRAQAPHRPPELPLAPQHPAAPLPGERADGGESTVTDGWAVVADLRARTRRRSRRCAGCRSPSSSTATTRTPRHGADDPARPDGDVRTFRFSNQLALPLNASFDDVGAFYDAYRMLGRMIDSDRYKVAFKAETGDLLTVHGHRVMHGRLAFDPTSGARHLQDVYMEYDDFMARARVLTAPTSRLPRPKRPAMGEQSTEEQQPDRSSRSPR